MVNACPQLIYLLQGYKIGSSSNRDNNNKGEEIL